jgi:polynucleotide 5'-kinase involved in rRNA processing
LEIDKLVFRHSLLFNGRPVEGTGLLYCEKSAEGLVAVTGRRMQKEAHTRVVPAGFEENLLCAVGDRSGNVLGLAIIRRIDFAERRITFTTPVQSERITTVQFGDIYVSPEGEELGRRRPGEF